MNIQRLDYLIGKIERQDISEEERHELTSWYRSYSEEQGLTPFLSHPQRQQLERLMWDRVRQAINQLASNHRENERPEGRPGSRAVVFRINPAARWVAAAIVFVILIGGYLLLQKGRTTHEALPVPIAGGPVHDALPGGNHATLTLADGKVIPLDSARDGMLGQSSGVAIFKQKAGQLVYRADDKGGSSERETAAVERFNVLSTPKGGQYRILLPDGTGVWVNAASTLRYPDHFSGKDRTVELDGEAYFEVAQDAARPFIVRTRDMDIHVLGTHFDVMDYKEDRHHVATLLEGAVMVKSGQREALLKPGQQAKTDDAGNQLNVLPADGEAAIAWKNGLFQFKDADLPSILAQVARWYDIDVVFAGPAPVDLYRGKISRYVTLSKLLKIFELNGVHFKLTGKTLTVIS